MDWLSVVIEEYRTLRNESLVALQTQQSVLRFGLAIIGIVIAIGFSLWEKSLLPEIIFLLLIPVASYLVLIIWMGEIARMTRAGMFLAELERKVNKEFSNKPEALRWENWLRKTQHDGKTPQLLLNYYAIIFLFLGTAIGSVIIGNFKLWKAICIPWAVTIDISEVVLFLVVFFLVYRLGKQFKQQ